MCRLSVVRLADALTSAPAEACAVVTVSASADDRLSFRVRRHVSRWGSALSALRALHSSSARALLAFCLALTYLGEALPSRLDNQSFDRVEEAGPA